MNILIIEQRILVSQQQQTIQKNKKTRINKKYQAFNYFFFLAIVR